MILSPNWHWGLGDGGEVDFLTLGEGLLVAGIVALGLLVAIVYDAVKKRRKP